MDSPASLIAAIGRDLIAILFLVQGISAARYRFTFHTERLRAHHLPVPQIALVCGFAMMFIGSFLLIANFYAGFGAFLLFVFTATATVLYQNFWAIEDQARRREKRSAFVYNLAILGGLLVVLAESLSR